jgi:YtkA-like
MALNLGDFAMNVFTKQFFAAAGVITTLWVASASPLFAGVQDYEFQLVQNEAKKGDAIVAVRLVNKRTGEAVSDAVIAAKRIDMAPDGMADMAGRIEQLPSTEPGVYRFKANLSMQGSWQLSLAAKVQGENGTVESKLVLKVLP